MASVHAQTQPAHEVLVVIDHNPALHQAAATLPARVLQNEEVQGLSGARNTGVRHAQGDIVAFLDDDAYAEPDWLELLVSAYADPTVVGVGGGVVPDFEGERPAFLPAEFDWVVGCSYVGQPSTSAVVRNVIGANMSFRRAAFERAGGFATSLGRVGDRPLGCEETEFCIRATTAWRGGRVLLQPGAQVHHHVPGSRASWSYFRSRCYAEGLSKAAVARLAGAGPGLASERHYVTRTLPGGVRRGITDALLRRRRGGLARAAAILIGLTWTTAGYTLGTIRLRSGRARVQQGSLAHTAPVKSTPRELAA